MGILKSILGIVIIVAIVVFGYWLYATYTMASADDKIWIKINSYMPAPLRKWSCDAVNARLTAGNAPASCGEFRKQGAEESTSSHPVISVEKPASNAAQGFSDY